RQVEDKLLKVVPGQFLRDAHHWLILHGRYVCVARKPRCGSCVLEDICEFKNKTDA
ncbi:MAG: endonuclease III, partial [Pseudomonadales bacterium]